MRFFIDENLSAELAAGMRGFGEDVVHAADEVGKGTPDAEWLEYIGTLGMTLITRDRRILTRPAEMAAFRKYSVGAFFLHGQHLKMWPIIQQLVRNWPEMKKLAADTDPPFAFKVYASHHRPKPLLL